MAVEKTVYEWHKLGVKRILISITDDNLMVGTSPLLHDTRALNDGILLHPFTEILVSPVHGCNNHPYILIFT